MESERDEFKVRFYIARKEWAHKDIRYQEFWNPLLPINHSSGHWEHGFEFNNDYFLLLGIL